MITQSHVQNHLSGAERKLNQVEALVTRCKKIQDVPSPHDLLKIEDKLSGLLPTLKPDIAYAGKLVSESRDLEENGHDVSEVKRAAKKLKKTCIKIKEATEKLKQVYDELRARYDNQHYAPEPTITAAGNGYSDRAAGGLVRR